MKSTAKHSAVPVSSHSLPSHDRYLLSEAGRVPSLGRGEEPMPEASKHEVAKASQVLCRWLIGGIKVEELGILNAWQQIHLRYFKAMKWP